MSNTISSIARIVRGLVALAFLGLIASGGWLAYQTLHQREILEDQLREKTEQLAVQAAHIEELTRKNEKLNLALRLLKIDHRVAEMSVVEQTPGKEHVTTKLEFAELTSDGNPVGAAKTFSVEGDTVYVDTWVIKFADEAIEAGDPLRSTAVCLFRRIFGEYQQPTDGFPIDPSGSRPAVYSQGNEMSPLEKDIWANFWQYANNPTKLKEAGLRAAHGEAPSIRVEPGKRYKLLLRASAGLSIVAEDAAERPAS